MERSSRVWGGLSGLGWVLCASVAMAQAPDHPLITEAYQNPPGTDGPVGRTPTNRDQEFIELYLPLASNLRPGLNKDALRLAVYDVEGDVISTSIGRVNWRVDLPTFDLDPNNGLTPGALPRPASGAVVIGWVDYLGNPPIDLAGTPSSRVALVQGGVTSTPGSTFIALNGNQFGGTTNFATPVAISFLNLTTHPVDGLIEQGSGVLLLVNRDAAGYLPLCSHSDPTICNSNASLALGTSILPSTVLDAWAPNDDPLFDPLLQPTTGLGIDLEPVLPPGGAFTLLAPQVPEEGEGYARRFPDVRRTTEDAVAGNDNPALDYKQFRTVNALGPLLPTPGSVALSTSPAELALTIFTGATTSVLVDTIGRPDVTAANLGGNVGMTLVTAPSRSPVVPHITVAGLTKLAGATGQTTVHPQIEIDVPATTPSGENTLVTTTVTATPTNPGDPAVVNGIQLGFMQVVAVDPKTGQDVSGLPFQATSLLAVMPLLDQAGVSNELRASSFGQFLLAQLGNRAQGSEGHANALLASGLDLTSGPAVAPLVAALPTNELLFIEEPGPSKKLGLVDTILNSAEFLSGNGSYAASFDSRGRAVKARRFTIDTATGQTLTKGGSYVPTEHVYYASPGGGATDRSSGFADATTRRSFELAVVDTNQAVLEEGGGDDFGIVVKAARVRTGSPVVPGEFVFLSYMGGRQGEDIDSLAVGPGHAIATVSLIDLDALDTQLGVEAISDVYLIDANGSSQIDPLEVFTLHAVPEPGLVAGLLAGLAGLAAVGRRDRRPVTGPRSA
ncbi:MAG: hypothetical protein U0900_23010 [Myxococcota bacterium]